MSKKDRDQRANDRLHWSERERRGTDQKTWRGSKKATENDGAAW